MEQKVKNNDPIEQATGGGKIIKQKENRPPRKRKSNEYKIFYNTLNAGLKPPSVLFETFMKEAELMETYTRYGEAYYEDISFICNKFEKAFADNDIDQMINLYDDLESLKLQHRRNAS